MVDRVRRLNRWLKHWRFSTTSFLLGVIATMLVDFWH
jgi:hypothetical protein